MPYQLGAVKPWVEDAANEIGPKFGIVTIYGVGSRSNVSDHPLGLALDFMVYGNRAKGDAVASYCIANLDRLGITYILWQQRIYHFGKWEAMEDRGSDTANHRDHVHVSFTADGNPRGSNSTSTDRNTVIPAGNNPIVPDQLEALADGVRWITDQHNLIRVGMVILGGVLLILALFGWAGMEIFGRATKAVGKSAIGNVTKNAS